MSKAFVPLDPTARAEFYASSIGRIYPASTPVVVGRWLMATWILGNNYRGSGYYGAYPPGYLPRLRALFPDVEIAQTLHVFSGSLSPDHGDTLDVQPVVGTVRPTYLCRAEDMANTVPHGRYRLVACDPPYSREDAKRYSTPYPNMRRVFDALAHVVPPRGMVAWMSTQLPMYRKSEWHFWGAITLIRSTNHRVRLVSLFERIRGPHLRRSYQSLNDFMGRRQR